MEALHDLWPDDDLRDDALQRLLRRVLASHAAAGDEHPKLTPPQQRCLFAASLGLEWRESAQLFGLSEHTVREHLRNARRVLAAKNTTHAVATAIRCNLIP